MKNLVEPVDGPTLYVSWRGQDFCFYPPIHYRYICARESLLAFRLKFSLARNEKNDL